MRVVLTGASGQLGAYLVDRLVRDGRDVVAWSGTDVGKRSAVELYPIDLTNAEAMATALGRFDPDAIVHAAAMSSADAVRRDPSRADAVNVEATRRLAAWCARRDRRMIFTSTDLVFDGTKAWSREEDPAEPIVAYGCTKREAEVAVLAASGGLVARISLLFGPSRCGREAYYDRTIAALGRGEPQAFFEDEYRTPLDYATAAAILAGLVANDVAGLLHVGGRERVSRYELVRRAASVLGFDVSLVRSNRRSDAGLSEPRPADVSLDTSRLATLLPDVPRPTIEEAVRASAVAGT